jgi:hypothetical protein
MAKTFLFLYSCYDVLNQSSECEHKTDRQIYSDRLEKRSTYPIAVFIYWV